MRRSRWRAARSSLRVIDACPGRGPRRGRRVTFISPEAMAAFSSAEVIRSVAVDSIVAGRGQTPQIPLRKSASASSYSALVWKVRPWMVRGYVASKPAAATLRQSCSSYPISIRVAT